MDRQKIYFPNLNGLRFVAAFLVIIHHIEQIKSISNISNYWGVIPFINIIGKLGVVLFFVLSGFLITYLLLAEEGIHQRISIKAFYIRRILRIWPLYFLIILLAFFVLPNIGVFSVPGFGKDVIYKDLGLKIILYVFFLPNLALGLFGVIPFAAHTWSIGTEEQYYLVWPVLLKWFKKYRIVLMVFVVCFYLFVATALNSHHTDFVPYRYVIINFWSNFNIDCMAIGGFYAILLYQNSKYLAWFKNEYVFYLSILLTIILMIKGVYIPYIHCEFYAFLFGIIILNFAANSRIRLSLENRMLNYLGKISYGLYMYHQIGIVLALHIAVFIGSISNWILYPLSLMLTIILAALSYKYYESIFLRFKNKFSEVISGDLVSVIKN